MRIVEITRLLGIELFEVRRADLASREQIATLAGDDDAQVAIAACGKLPHAGSLPDDEFGRQRLLPVLRAAMAHREPKVRAAAFGAVSQLVGAIASRADDFRAAGATDPDADARMAALGTLTRIAPNAAAPAQKEWELQRDASWPQQALQMLRDGESGKLGMAALTFLSVAAPIFVGWTLLVYCMARLLPYVFPWRWRALVVLPVMAI